MPTRLRQLALGRVLLLSFALLFVLLPAWAAAQQSTALSLKAPVELRVQLSWYDPAPDARPRATTFVLQPLDSPGAAQTLRVSESATAIVRLPPGRYQLTTTDPLMVNGQAYGWSIELPLVAPTNDLRLSQENAVRVALPAGVFAASSAGSASVAQPGNSPAVADEDTARRQIMALLDLWVDSLKLRNLQVQMSCYAPQLKTYLQQANVSRRQVQQLKQSQLRRYPAIRQLSLSNVVVKWKDGEAQVTALKTWNFSGSDASWEGQAIIQFDLVRTGARWLIESEREQLVPYNRLATQTSSASSRTPQ